MKQKKERWFIKNRVWIAFFLLFVLIVLANFVFDRGKILIKYGFEWSSFILFLALFLVFIVLFAALFFFYSYYDDAMNQTLKKRFKWYDLIIQKILDKES